MTIEIPAFLVHAIVWAGAIAILLALVFASTWLLSRLLRGAWFWPALVSFALNYREGYRLRGDYWVRNGTRIGRKDGRGEHSEALAQKEAAGG